MDEKRVLCCEEKDVMLTAGGTVGTETTVGDFLNSVVGGFPLIEVLVFIEATSEEFADVPRSTTVFDNVDEEAKIFEAAAARADGEFCEVFPALNREGPLLEVGFDGPGPGDRDVSGPAAVVLSRSVVRVGLSSVPVANEGASSGITPCLSASIIRFTFSLSSSSNSLSLPSPISCPFSSFPVRTAFCRVEDLPAGNTEVPKDAEALLAAPIPVWRSALKRETPLLECLEASDASGGTF